MSSSRLAPRLVTFFGVGALLLAGAAGLQLLSRSETQAQAAAPPTANVLRQVQDAFTSVAKNVEPSVVSITAERKVSTAGDSMPDIFRGFPFGGFGGPQMQPRESTQIVGGSGVIVRPDGYILTNDHVVGGMTDVQVKLKDGRTFPGKVLRDSTTDLDLVKIDAHDLPAATLGDSNKLEPGQWAIAIGSPFGLRNTLTVGVVSALEREAEISDDQGGQRYYPSLIQTDASINPGNSGGPLLNIDGEVVGINVAIESPTGANAGIGYAIPIDTAKWVMDQLITKGKVVRGYLGVGPSDLSPTDAERYGVAKGALISSVMDDTPAARAGLQVEDVIVEFDGKPIKNALDLRNTVARTAPGAKVDVVIVRDKQRKTLPVTVGTFHVNTPGLHNANSTSTVGISVQELTPDLRQQYNVREGVKGVIVANVTPGSAADRAGISVGDVIIRVNNQAVPNPDAYANAVGGIKPGDTVTMILRRKDATMAIEFRIPLNP